MALPALHLLRSAGFPLILVGRPWARDLLAGLEPLDFVPLEGPLRKDVEAVRQRLRPGADVSKTLPAGPYRGVCFPDSISSALVFRLAGVRAGGYRDDGRSLLLKWPVSKLPGPLHVVESYFYLVRTLLVKWGLPMTLPSRPGPTLDLPLTAAHEHVADAALERAAFDRPFVLLSPTATGLHRGRIKSWPHYEALARDLKASGWAVAICPPPSEVDSARSAVPGAHVLPSLPLGAYAALTRRAALVVCNDSGTSHIAAAAQSRQITLFGVTHRERTGPWSPHAVCLGDDNHWPTLDEVSERALSMLNSGNAETEPADLTHQPTSLT